MPKSTPARPNRARRGNLPKSGNAAGHNFQAAAESGDILADSAINVNPARAVIQAFLY